jgi:tRNA threonylcarbamoyladenosine biosynthesis protein TsaB
MAIILNIDTSSATLYVSISKNGQLLADKIDEEQRNHASNLQPFVDSVVKASKLTLQDINAVAVMNGPGSYTGLRVGLAAAKGYCFALDIPLICISNLAALAAIYFAKNPHNIASVQSVISTMKNELFIETYNANLECVATAQHLQINEKSSDFFRDNCLLTIGNISDDIISGFSIHKFENTLYSYMIINSLSNIHFTHNKFFDILSTEPNYIKQTHIN